MNYTELALKAVRHLAKSLVLKTPLGRTHSDEIRDLLKQLRVSDDRRPVFVETGAGLTTMALARAGKQMNAIVYSCDANEQLLARLREKTEGLADIELLAGSSLESLREIAEKHPRIDFLYLDSAASALHTFHEFRLVEESLPVGSIVLIDNATVPGTRFTLTPCRKGKILVPYLLASAYWEVRNRRLSGDSMVSAIRREQPSYADPAYEDPDYVDNWIKRV